MLKIHTVQLTGNLSFIGLQARAAVVAVGDDTDHAWGGGRITSLEYDRKWNGVLVRKEKPFRHIGGVLKPFDVAVIPWQHVLMARVVDEPDAVQAAAPAAIQTQNTPTAKIPDCSKCGQFSNGKPLCEKCDKPQDPPPAKPVQQQSSQRR